MHGYLAAHRANPAANLPLQPTLLELPPPVVAASPLQERFEAFHQANPEVYRALRDLALAMKGRGFRRWSIKAAWEIARWQFPLRAQGSPGGAGFKLCNDFHAFYARLLMAREPRLQGFFELRRQRQER